MTLKNEKFLNFFPYKLKQIIEWSLKFACHSAAFSPKYSHKKKNIFMCTTINFHEYIWSLQRQKKYTDRLV